MQDPIKAMTTLQIRKTYSIIFKQKKKTPSKLYLARFLEKVAGLLFFSLSIV